MAKDTSVRNRELRFYKDGDGWFADVAGHTQSQNRMVAGADKLIERFAGGRDEVRVLLSADISDPDEYQIKLHRIEHDFSGATYWVSGGKRFATIPVAWLCNVTHTVFGEHPKDIYIHSIAA